MRKFQGVVSLFSIALAISSVASALDHQPVADYHARREALAKKAGGVVVYLAPLEPPDSVYAFRQDDNFYYLSGLTVPGAALLVAPAVEAEGGNAVRVYMEILFLPPHNLRLEKYTGPQLGADTPDAAKITGFDRVEDMGKLPDEVSKILTGARPTIYTDVSTQGETTASTQALSFLKRTNAVVSFQDVKPALSSLRTVKDFVGRRITSPKRSRLFIELKNGNRAYCRGVGSTAKKVPCVPSAGLPSPLE